MVSDGGGVRFWRISDGAVMVRCWYSDGAVMVGYRETSPSTHNVTDGHHDVCDHAFLTHFLFITRIQTTVALHAVAGAIVCGVMVQ